MFLGAAVGAVPVVIFTVAALLGEPDTRPKLFLAGLCVGVALFAVIALSKPAQRDD